MIAIVHPSRISGAIRAPRSKSDMQRACAAALLHQGVTHIIDPGKSNDDLAALDVISKLGAEVAEQDNIIIIKSDGVHPFFDEINCGESGLGIRMFTPIAALSARELNISGTGSLLSRPMHFFDIIFPQLGISIQSNEGKLPLAIKGPMVPSSIEVDGSLSSQFLTGLLMAYAAAGASGVTITVKDLKSKPYIDLTLAVLKSFGMKVPVVKDYETFTFPAVEHVQPTGEISYRVEGDWSGAYHVGPADLHAFHFDATECPDLFPPLVALAAYCTGNTVIKGALRLTHKESNRALTLQDVFGKMGVQIDLDGDLMIVHGNRHLKGAKVHSHHDHRIAMAAAVAGLGADGEVLIEEAEAINKSYPDFYEHLKALGSSIALQTV